MLWQHQLKGDPLAWLLALDSPGVRYLAMRDLLDMPSDDPGLRAAAQAAHTQGPIATILAHMDPAGYWAAPGPGYNPKYRSTVWSVITLAQLGAAYAADERIAQACDYLVTHALMTGGSAKRNEDTLPEKAWKETLLWMLRRFSAWKYSPTISSAA